MTYSLFTYGTLEIAEIMQRVTGKNFRTDSAVLMNYGRYKIKDEVYPGVIKEMGSKTPGTIYYGLDECDLQNIDRYEDVCYQRINLPVRITDSNQVDAMVYVIKEQHRELLSGYAWDKDYFVKHELAAFKRLLTS